MDMGIGKDLLFRPLLDPHGLDEGVQKRAGVIGAENLRIWHAQERLHSARGMRVGDAEAGNSEGRFVPNGVGHGWFSPNEGLPARATLPWADLDGGSLPDDARVAGRRGPWREP